MATYSIATVLLVSFVLTMPTWGLRLPRKQHKPPKTTKATELTTALKTVPTPNYSGGGVTIGGINASQASATRSFSMDATIGSDINTTPSTDTGRTESTQENTPKMDSPNMTVSEN